MACGLMAGLTPAMIGVALLAMALCFGPLPASAAGHPATHAKVHRTARKGVRAKSANARLRNASYKTPTRKRRVRYRRRRYRHHVTLPKAPARDRTEQIQSALERGGYYAGNPNGRWDGGTQEALRRFQAANGLPPTGKLNAPSLQKLGLGSDVAGLSAPGRVITGDQSLSQPPSSPAQKTPSR